MKLQFLGAARQVTGSCYLVDAGGLRLLIDCGMYQEREFLGRNWAPFAVAPDAVDFVLLTHAHLDHSGLLPKLVAGGFDGRVLTTAPSRELTEIVLEDAGHLQEEDAAFKKRRHQREGRKGRYPEVPLYTARDVRAVLPLFKRVNYDEPVRLNDQVTATYRDAGHILGSAMLELTVRANGDMRTLVFSGDMGQWDRPIVRDPTFFDRADYIVMESTYGDRSHDERQTVEDQLCEVINSTVDAGGNIVIPTFAIERAQELLYYLGGLVRSHRIPHLMAFLDSPMAVEVTEVFRRHPECMDAEALSLLDSGHRLFGFPRLQLVRRSHESKAINRIRGSCIIMAGSGMCTGGRIKHHLIRNISRPESTIVFVGYQARGTLGREIVNGTPVVRIHGGQHPVKARVVEIHGLSAHADRDEILTWLGHLKEPPRRLFLTHGDDQVIDNLASQIRSRWSWPVDVPEYRAEVELD